MAIFSRKTKKGQGRRGVGFSPAMAGVIAIVVIGLLTFEGFTRFNPFRSPFELKATFATANNLQPKSPVRIAGVNVGAVKEVKPLGIEVRAGLHTGECEVMGDDFGGIAVHIGARVAALAGPSEVLVSRTVRDLVAGSGLRFRDRGSPALKGVPGEWSLFAVER